MIIERIERTDRQVVDGFRALLRHESITCAVSDCLERGAAMTADLRPLFEGIRVVGTAVTARALASDLSAPFKAIDVAEPGDVVVIDSHGSTNTAFWGENMTMSAVNRGVLAAVIDGACRDVEELRRLRFPVLSRGVVPNVGSISGYGEVNVPIQCAGVPVCPGDVVVIDGNGVVVVPRLEAARVLAAVEALVGTEDVVKDRIRAGATIGQLVGIDEVFRLAFAYQERAATRDSSGKPPNVPVPTT